MKNKTTRSVFIIIVIAILVMAFSVSIAYEVENKKVEVIDSRDGTKDIEDIVNDDPKTDKPTKGEDDPKSEEENNNKPKTYTSSQGFLCYMDAMELLKNGKGFEIQSKTSGVALGETQWVDETIIMSKNYYYKTDTAYTTMPSMGKTYFRYFYSNDGGQNIEYKKTNSLNGDKSPNWSNGVEQSILNRESVKNYDGYALKPFAIEPTSKKELVSFNRTDKKYYQITFKINNIPNEYIENIKHEGDLDWVNVNTINLTYYIEKATMYIRKVEKSEVYNSQKIVKFSCKTKQVSIIKQIDKEIIPQKPTI